MTTAILSTLPDSRNTELIGIAPGVAEVHQNGQKLTTLFGRDPLEIHQQYYALLDELRTERPTPDWYICDKCGRSVDVDTDCPDCHPPAILWITATGRRFLEPLTPAAPADCLEDCLEEADILVNDEWWLTADLDATPDTFTVRKIEEGVL